MIRTTCPDGGACHHKCHDSESCWRVQNASPLSGVFPGDVWPCEWCGTVGSQATAHRANGCPDDPAIGPVPFKLERRKNCLFCGHDQTPSWMDELQHERRKVGELEARLEAYEKDAATWEVEDDQNRRRIKELEEALATSIFGRNSEGEQHADELAAKLEDALQTIREWEATDDYWQVQSRKLDEKIAIQQALLRKWVAMAGPAADSAEARRLVTDTRWHLRPDEYVEVERP